MSDDPNDLSRENLDRLIETMPQWSMSGARFTKAQTAAWRLHWFGKTPEDDARAREDFQIGRADELARGFDRYASREREPFIDWPNGQGTDD